MVIKVVAPFDLTDKVRTIQLAYAGYDPTGKFNYNINQAWPNCCPENDIHQ